MAKIWINPAFKDKIKQDEPKKEVKEKKKEIKQKKKEETPKPKKEVKQKETDSPKPEKAKQKPKKQKGAQGVSLYSIPDHGLELKFLQHLMNSRATLEVKILGGPTFTGKIKWIYQWLMGLELEDNKIVGFSRLNLSHYSIKQSESISEEEITKLSVPEIPKDNIFQQYKNDKTLLIFHLRDGLSIKGTIEWYDKILYHIRSIDGEKEYNITRESILYFEEATGNE